MAKDDPDIDEDEDEEEGGGKKKLVMIVGGLAAAGAAYQFVLKPAPVPPAEAAPVEAVAEPTVTTMVAGEIVELEEMILNIGGQDASGYLRIGMAIVLEEGIAPADFEAEVAIAKDVAVHYLSAQEPASLRSPEGRDAAKAELSTLIREAYGNEKVMRVLFTSMVMQ